MNDLLSEKTIIDVANRLGYHTYKYPRPGVCSDIIIGHILGNGEEEILLIKRKHEPFKDCWALPGGFVNEGERFIEAAKRELQEETGIVLDKLYPVLVADKSGRDPRGWTIAHVFEFCFTGNKPKVKAADDAAEYKWFNIRELPELAFDHEDILNYWFYQNGYYANN